MRVTHYQMHHVLDCYSKKLSRASKEEKTRPTGADHAPDEVSLSAESLRQAALEKISLRIFSKIDEVRALTHRREQTAPDSWDSGGEAAAEGAKPAGARFPHPGPDSAGPRSAPAPTGDGAPAPARKYVSPAPGGHAGKKESWA